jgi:hypothetical protein
MEIVFSFEIVVLNVCTKYREETLYIDREIFKKLDGVAVALLNAQRTPKDKKWS